MNYELPLNFLNRMKFYFPDEYEEFLASYNHREVRGIRFNELAQRDNLCAISDKKGFENLLPVPWCGMGFYYDENELRPGKHPYYEAGVYYIQEPSAMAPVNYLDILPGDRVLDLCASPGGKSTQIAGRLKGEGILVSNEINADRAKVLSENIERAGVRNALVISEDPKNISNRFERFFNKILVDAPCSGEGMFRKSETAVKEWSEENVKMCAKRQSWILDEAAKMLDVGGIIVYSTCTFSKEENEEQVLSFLNRHKDFELCKMELFAGMRKGFDGIGIRILSSDLGEGHYMCAMKKSGDDTDGYFGKYEKDMSKNDRASLKEMFSFFDEYMRGWGFLKEKKLTAFRENIYMLPDFCPLLDGLRVMRPGLHLGTNKKGRFEPGHALIMAVSPTETVNICKLDSQGDEIIRYVSGESLNFSGNNGWCGVFVDDFSIGWGKITNNILKNHFPKGLRKQLCKQTG